MAPGITVLMPVYNASQFLEEAIVSILNQTFENFEFLILDDGSTDNSVSIIRKFSDPRIKLFQNERNLGISATLNRGIEMASCELIARMDADDISYPDRLQKQFDYMTSHSECGLLSTWARVVTADKKPVTLEKHPYYYYYYNLNFECWIYHPTVMFRREIVRKCGMYSKPFSEDYDLFWKVSQEAVIHNLDEALVDYRISPYSLNTVLRKEEYDAANRENVIRNLQHYMGSDFYLPDPYLECMRHNFLPIIALKDIQALLDCLEALDQITAAILSKPNPNRVHDHIFWAAYHKKDFIIEQLFLQLSGFNKFSFVFRVGKPGILFRKIRKSLRWRFNSVKQQFLSPNKH